MFRRLWNALKAQPAKRVIHVPDSIRLPSLWPAEGAAPDLEAVAGASSEILMELCDSYWNSYLAEFEDQAENARVIRAEGVHRAALEALAQRGADVIPWAQARLQHPDYAAREDTAWLLGRFAERRELGRHQDAVARDLAVLATRRWQKDTKELQANSAALASLATLGGPVLMTTLGEILTSPHFNDDDLQWDAAVLLTQNGADIASADDLVMAAKTWLATHGAAGPGSP